MQPPVGWRALPAGEADVVVARAAPGGGGPVGGGRAGAGDRPAGGGAPRPVIARSDRIEGPWTLPAGPGAGPGRRRRPHAEAAVPRRADPPGLQRAGP